MMALVQLFITFLGFCFISGETVRDLTHHNSEFSQGDSVHVHNIGLIGRPRGRFKLRTNSRQLGNAQKYRQVVKRVGTRVVVVTGRFSGQKLRRGGRRGKHVTIRRSKVRRQRIIRGGRGKLVHSSVKRTKSSVSTRTVRKSSGKGWTRRVILTTNKGKKRKSKKRVMLARRRGRRSRKPFNWKVRSMKMKVRQFRGGYVRFRGKWYVSKNGRMYRPNKKARAKLKRKLNRKFSGALKKIKRAKAARFFKKLMHFSRRKLGRIQRKDNRQIMKIQKLLRRIKLAKRFKRRKKTIRARMHFLRDVIQGLRKTLAKARKSPCIRKNYKHLKGLRKITCSGKRLRWLSKHGRPWATKELKKRRQIRRATRKR